MIFRSPFPDIVVPDVPLHDLLLRRADELPDKPALIDAPTGRTITYGQLTMGARLIAASLARRGFQKGDVFAIYSPNLPEYAAAILAVSLAGGAVTTVNPLYTADELAFQLSDTGAIYLLTIPQFLDKARDAAARSQVRELFVLGEAEGATPFALLLAGDGRLPDVSFDVANDVVALPYSSGTTGFPKGVMSTHRSLGANVVQVASALSGLSEDGTVMGVLPFYHIYGITVILGVSPTRAPTIVTLPRFEIEQFLQALQDYGVTYGAARAADRRGAGEASGGGQV